MWFAQERLGGIWRRRSGRFLLLTLLILSPLVLTLGIQTKLSRFQFREFSIETNRERCLRIAQEFVESRGGSQPARWVLRFDQDEQFLEFVHRSLGEGKFIPRFRRFPTAPAAIGVISGEGEDAVRVTVGPSGRVVGYRLPFLLEKAGSGVASRESAVAAAREQLQAVVSEEDYLLSPERVYEQTDPRGRRLHRIEWTATSRALPELSFTIRYGVIGDVVFSQHVEASIDRSYRERSGLVSALYRTISSLAPFYIAALLVYMLARYIQRTLEKEVSHGRAIVVALYILAMVAVIFLTGDQGIVLNIDIGSEAPRAVYLFLFFFLGLGALLAGASYSACEGDVREYLKGSMTAFDALLTGRIFSKNVARAFVAGFVSACWLFFGEVMAKLALEGGLEEPSSLVFVYRMAHAHFPAAMVFLLLPLGIAFVLLFSLLIPLSILGRLNRLRRTAWALVLGLVMINLFLLHGGFVSLSGAVVLLGMEAATLLALLHYFDLMTVFLCRTLAACIAVLTDVQMLTRMPEDAVLPMHGIVLGTLLLSLVLLRYGKEYTDEQVRPSYARALAERQTLSAQLSAAAVAQAQLQRASLPAVEGFSLAAACRPARVVSGDYYDAFSLGPRSAGLLMISGAGRGLVDAMVIAFAKGFLVERVQSARSAPELLADLLENLSSLLQAGDVFPELCYVTLDGASATASYSRTEGFPGIVTVRAREDGAYSVREGSNAEMSVIRQIGERSLAMRHGTISLEEQTSLLIFSCGFARSIERSGVENFREWLRREWAGLFSTDAAATLQKLTGAVLSGSASWQSEGGSEDRTLIVIHTVEAASRHAEKAA